MRAVLYCRVSTVEQAQNLSLPTQEQACRAYCAREGYEVDAVFVDAGESAKTIERPEFLRMIEHCRRSRGKVSALVVYSLTRFARNNADHHAIALILRKIGVTLRSVTEPIDDTPAGRLMEGVLASMAQFDNDVRAERVVAGMKAAVDRGRWCWQAPIGYRNGDARRGPSLMPDPDRAPAVREAFRLYDAGVQGRELLQRVAALGLTSTKKGGQPISMSGLYNLLRQRAYIGYIQPKGWPKESRGDFEPLVSEELFMRVQRGLNGPTPAAKSKSRHVNHPDFPLRRFVRCSCGKSLTGSWSSSRTKTKYAFYACQRGCQRHSKATLESAFLALMDTLRPRPECWGLLKAATIDTWHEATKEASTARNAARRHLETLEGRMERLQEAYIHEQAIDDVTFRRMRDKLREDIAMARLTLSDLDEHAIDVEGMLDFAEDALTRASLIWTNAGSVEERINLQWTFFPEGLRLAPAKSQSNQAQGGVDLELFEPPLTCLKVFHLPPLNVSDSELVGPSRLTWNHLLGWLRHMQRARVAA